MIIVVIGNFAAVYSLIVYGYFVRHFRPFSKLLFSIIRAFIFFVHFIIQAGTQNLVKCLNFVVLQFFLKNCV